MDADEPLDHELLVLVRRARPGAPREAHDVGGSEDAGSFGSIPNSSIPFSVMRSLYDLDADTAPALLRSEEVDGARDDLRERDERRRRSGAGASSSSLSLHPRPVVRPMPPRRSLPSRCRTLRWTVSRSSLKSPFFVMIDPTGAHTGTGVNVTHTHAHALGQRWTHPWTRC